MKITADFSTISTSFENLPEGDYNVRVEEIEEGESRANKLPQLRFQLEVLDGPMAGRVISDFVTLMQNDGKPNKIGQGRVKAYAEAILGAEAANGSAIDTDELKGGSCTILVKPDSYEKNGKTETSSKVAKVLPLG